MSPGISIKRFPRTQVIGPFRFAQHDRHLSIFYFRRSEHGRQLLPVRLHPGSLVEDRFSNLDQSNPENTSLHNSDGVLTFSTGAFAAGLTVEEATYRMWAIDGGIKWRGWALNGQYYFRWLNDFTADGPMPLSSTFDRGGELSLGYFVVPKKLELYAHTSAVFGQFNNSYE
jgi:hypothetical protein